MVDYDRESFVRLEANEDWWGGKPEIDEKVKLDPESFDRIVTWIDSNAPYYPSYAGGAFRDNLYGRSWIFRAMVRKDSKSLADR